MSPQQALKQAASVAREAARLGLADQGELRGLYSEYEGYLRKGVDASFIQLLQSRGVIDATGARRLQASLAPASSTTPAPLEQLGSRASGVVSLGGAPPPGLLGEQTANYPVVLTPEATGPGGPDKNTSPFPVVLNPDGSGPGLVDDPEPMVERTMEFDRVIPNRPAPASGGLDLAPLPGPPDSASDPMMRTMEYGEVLPSSRPPANDELLLPADDGELEFPDELTLAASAPLGITPSGSHGSSGSGDSNTSMPEMGMTFDTLDPTDVMSTADSTGSRGSGGSGPSSDSGDYQAPPPDMFMSSEEEEEDATPPEPGDVLGRYTLVAAIGQGGMGVIYTAKRDDGEMFALKVLLGAQGVGADRRRQRFRREVEAMRRLEHECIVRVYDYGRQGPFDWYTMDYVQGRDFEKLLEKHSLEDAENMKVFEDICAAMAHAHERNVIHRDLKPQNVLVDARNNRGKVLDFGLAKILDQGVGMTRTGSALGTPYYMAPEQLKSAKHIDARADVFSLGVILYEVTTGVRPFLGETAAEVGNKILTTEPPRPTKLKPHLHPDIDAMVVRALEKDPAHRYPDAGAFYEDLIKHRKGLGVAGASGLSGALGEGRRWFQRNKTVALAVGATALLFTVVIVGLVVGMGSGKKPRVAVSPRKTPQESPGATRKTTRKTSSKTTRKTEEPKTSPSKAPRPKLTPPTRPSRTPKPSPSRVKPTPEAAVATPTPGPERTRTPVDLARVALQPPQEERGGGALALKETHSPEVVADLVRRLDARVLLPMASGDTELALAEAAELQRDRDITLHERFMEELQHDAKTLVALRNLVARRIEEDRKLIQNVTLYGSGERYDARKGDIEVLEGNFLLLDLGKGQEMVVDPCELSLRDLRKLVIDRKDKSVDNASAHYALAVLGCYRRQGETELDDDLVAALETTDVERDRAQSAVQRRRELIVWLGGARPGAWRAYEDAAGEAWREVERKRRNAKIHKQELERYLRAYGRSAAYVERREAYVDALLLHRPLTTLLGAQAKAKGGRELEWRFKKPEPIQDFEVTPFETKGDRPFRAELKSGTLQLENARLELELRDLVSHEGSLEFQSRASTPLEFYLSGVSQELDPDAGWKILFKGRPLKGVGDTRPRKLTKNKHLIFDRADDDSTREFFFRRPNRKLEAPSKLFERGPKKVQLGAAAVGDLKLTELRLEWRKDENPDVAPELRRALLARELSRLEVEESYKPQGVARAHYTLRIRPGSRVGFKLSEGWKSEEKRLVGKGGSTLWTARKGRYGRLRFRYAASDGPGVKLLVSASSVGRGKPVTWRLPAPVDPDRDRFREVTLYYNLEARVMTLFVDGVRLRTLTGSREVSMKEAYFGLELVGRTSARIEAFELLELQPAPLD
jgi:serine/threonine protein kinase